MDVQHQLEPLQPITKKKILLISRGFIIYRRKTKIKIEKMLIFPNGKLGFNAAQEILNNGGTN